MNAAYILLAAYTDKDDSRSSYSVSDKGRTGNPYLYAYYLDKNNKIKKYLTGSSTVGTSRSGFDNVVYGVFPTMSGVKTIRVFLKQSSVKNFSNAGVDVTFARPVLIEASSKSVANDLLEKYRRESIALQFVNTPPVTPPAPTPTPPSTSSTWNTTSCSGIRGTSMTKIGFEATESKDLSLRFGSSLAAWVYGQHDYAGSVSPYNTISKSQSYAGMYGMLLTNNSYGYVSGESATSPQLYDEALRYVTSGKFEKNGRYVFSLRAKYQRGSSNQPSVNLLLAQEVGNDGGGKFVGSKSVNVGDAWSCVEYDFINSEATSVTQDLALFFGSLPKTASLHLDDIQLMKR